MAAPEIEIDFNLDFLDRYTEITNLIKAYAGPYDDNSPAPELLIKYKELYLGFLFNEIDNISRAPGLAGKGDTFLDFEEMSMILQQDMDDGKCALSLLQSVT